MEDKNKGFKEQNIVIQNREKAVVTGVEDILSFDDELVIVQTDLLYPEAKMTNTRYKSVITAHIHLLNHRLILL